MYFHLLTNKYKCPAFINYMSTICNRKFLVSNFEYIQQDDVFHLHLFLMNVIILCSFISIFMPIIFLHLPFNELLELPVYMSFIIGWGLLSSAGFESFTHRQGTHRKTIHGNLFCIGMDILYPPYHIPYRMAKKCHHKMGEKSGVKRLPCQTYEQYCEMLWFLIHALNMIHS